MNTGERTTGIALEALDPLFFRDGRPFAAASRVASGLPMPQSLAGALRTHLLQRQGCDFQALSDLMKSGMSFESSLQAMRTPELAAIAGMSFRGPWFMLDGEPLVPVPACLMKIEDSGEVVRLSPLKSRPLPGWKPLPGQEYPLWCFDSRPSKRLPGYLDPQGLALFLQGGVPALTQVISADRLYGHDLRTGIGLNTTTKTAEEHLIYGVSLLALKDRVTLYAEVVASEDGLSLLPDSMSTLAFGGEGRRVAFRKTDPFNWPTAPTGTGQNRLLFLTAAGLFGGWRPQGLATVAAAVPGYMAVSGWDLARGGPKPNRFAAQAGSVYFLEDGTDSGPIASSLGDDVALGWGTCLEGAWNYV